jgi:hypothetical protein
MGSLYKPNTTDAEGKPLLVKNGPNTGQPRTNFFFAVAIAKGAEQHWGQTPWGAEIWRVGHTAFPQAASSPAFAWKIEDGDSVVPNKRGKKPVDNEGWKGHWILKFSGGFAPKVYREEAGGYVQETAADYVKPGHFVQVNGTVDGNGSQSQPGIYLNHSMVAFRAYGPEISFGPDVNEAGFGAAPLPAGASAVPLAASIPLPGAALPSAIPAAIPSPIASIPVTPNPQFLQVPATGVPAATLPSPIAAVPSPVPAVPVVPTMPAPIASPSSGPQMTAKAQGSSYQAFKSAGWDDANLIAQGYMTI